MKHPLTKEITLLNKALFIEDLKILVLSDIHIGYEESLNKGGVFIPRTQFKQTIEEIKEIISELPQIEKIIILGDLKHEFGKISQQEWNETITFLELLEKKCEEIILIKGNHDTILGPIAERKSIVLRTMQREGKYLFLHGDKVLPELENKKVEVICIGHMHPAIQLREGTKSEKYKCFLVGEYKKKKIIVLPSFFPLIEGTDTWETHEKKFNEIKIDNFNVYAIEDQVYSLGKRKNIEQK